MDNIDNILPPDQVAEFFQRERERITRYLRNHFFKITEEDAEEAFSRGCHALLEAIHSGRFTAEQHEYSLEKYLQTCCSNQMSKMLKERSNGKDEDLENKDRGDEDWDDENIPDDTGIADSLQHEQDLALMESILDNLPDPCRDLITWKYYSGFSATEAAQRLGYSSSRVAITTLSRCMKRLRTHFNEERRLTDE